MSSIIYTHTGVSFDLTKPVTTAVRFPDIAHALSKIDRYTGHSPKFYSVAQHSCHVAHLAVKINRIWDYGDDEMMVLKWGLLHDAVEAYLGDVSNPLKYTEYLRGYRFLEEAYFQVIAERFELTSEMPRAVKEADSLMLGVEVRDIWKKNPRNAPWNREDSDLVRITKCLNWPEAKNFYQKICRYAGIR